MAPNTEATNRVTEAEDVIVETLANLSEFQSLTNTVDATSAKEHIFVEILGSFSDKIDNKTLEDKTPYCLVFPPEDSPQTIFTAYAKGIPYLFQCDHSLQLHFAGWADPQRDEEAIRSWKNAVGDVMEAFTGEAGKDGKFGSTLVTSGNIGYAKEDNKQLPWLTWDWFVMRQSDVSQ